MTKTDRLNHNKSTSYLTSRTVLIVMSQSSGVYKIKLLRKLGNMKGHGAYMICVQHNRGKNQFVKLRRGTC